jgi:hypothetical protein
MNETTLMPAAFAAKWKAETTATCHVIASARLDLSRLST